MLSYASMPLETKKLANANLGRGVLKSVFSGSHEYHLMLKIEEGKLIGFAVYHFEERTILEASQLIGILDCIVIDAPSRKSGYGSNMTFAILRKMSGYGVNRVEILSKDPGYFNRDGEPGVPLASPDSILELLGFKKIRVFHDYYENQSTKYGYQCKFCGNSVDSCKAILYARDSDS